MERILIVTVNWLGDAIMTTPIPRALKEAFPSSYVAVLAVQRVKEIFENNPYIDEVISFDEKVFKKSFGAKLALAKRLRQKKFDTAFLIHRSFSRALTCWLGGIKQRIGYTRLKNIFLLTKRINPPWPAVHRQDYYLSLFEKCGIPVNDKFPQIFISSAANEKISSLLQGIRKNHKIIVGMNPSANWKLKRWPAENFARLADELIQNYNYAVVFIGALKEKEIIEKVIRNMRNPAYNLCGKTTLDELGVLMRKINIFISNDSGPAHLAAALGINTFVLFGPTSSQMTAPRGKHITIIEGRKKSDCKIPCYNLTCNDNVCMRSISVIDVLTEIKKLLDMKEPNHTIRIDEQIP